MNKMMLAGLVAAALYVPVAMADENGADSDRAHAGAYVTDSVITSKIKTKLAAKHMVTLKDIKVDTDNQGVVYLSGKAPTKDARDLAGMIAKDTDGVTLVQNKIVVAE
jgi:hyperosmotically inducible protein